jgi:hypothetical protein
MRDTLGAQSVSNMQQLRAQAAGRLSPGGWYGQPAPLPRNEWQPFRPSAKVRVTCVQWRSLCEPKDQEFRGGGHSSQPLASQSEVLRGGS